MNSNRGPHIVASVMVMPILIVSIRQGWIVCDKLSSYCLSLVLCSYLDISCAQARVLSW